MESDFNVESALLAAIYSDGDALFDVADRLTPGDFAIQAHALIYEVLRDRILDELPNDIVSIVADLESRGSLGVVGGGDGARRILGTQSGDVGSICHYADLIFEASKRRRIVELSKKLTEEAEHGGDVKVIGATLGNAISELSRDRTGFVSKMSQSADELRDRLHALSAGELTIDLLQSGFRDLDQIAKGLRSGQLCIIGARPGMGKTAFGLELALRAALDGGRRVMFFSLEMSVEELTERALASIVGIDLQRLQLGELDAKELGRVDEAVRVLRGADLILNADPMIRVGDIRVAAMRERARGSLGLIVVDYLQLLSGSSKFRSSDNRQAEVAEISRSLKLLARELEVPIIVLSQLSRNLESRHDKRPQLSDLRESGALEQDADLVLFIFREEVYDDKSPNKGLAEIIVAKHRNGPTGKAVLWFDPALMRFGNLVSVKEAMPESCRSEDGDDDGETWRQTTEDETLWEADASNS